MFILIIKTKDYLANNLLNFQTKIVYKCILMENGMTKNVAKKKLMFVKGKLFAVFYYFSVSI